MLSSTRHKLLVKILNVSVVFQTVGHKPKYVIIRVITVISERNKNYLHYISWHDCQDISLKTANMNLKVALVENAEDHNSLGHIL